IPPADPFATNPNNTPLSTSSAPWPAPVTAPAAISGAETSGTSSTGSVVVTERHEVVTVQVSQIHGDGRSWEGCCELGAEAGVVICCCPCCSAIAAEVWSSIDPAASPGAAWRTIESWIYKELGWAILTTHDAYDESYDTGRICALH
ncbi:17614_t:CDS:2, partial [Acaulospora colombiana]